MRSDSSHSGHLTLLQSSRSPRAPPAPCTAPPIEASGLGRTEPSQAGREVTAGPRSCATLPDATPTQRLTPCRWNPSPPAGCSVLAPSPMAALSLSLRCVAWSRGAGHALPDVTALSNRPTARLPRTRAPRTSGCEPGRELGSQSWESCSAGHQLSRAAAMSSDDSSLMVRERWAACARASSAAKTALP